MKILHISCVGNPSGSGVAVAIKSYLKNEKKFSDVALFNLKTDYDVDVDSYNIKNYKTISSLPNGYNKPDIVVFNEVYKKEYIKLYKECLKNKIPYVIIPHGSLVKVAQRKKFLKKKIGNIFLFNRFIKKSKAIQYLSEDEKNTSIFDKNYIISGNGVDKPNYINKTNNLDLIYIGRYAIYNKGLDLIVNICKKNHTWFLDNNVKVNLYGRTSGNDLEILKNMVLKEKLNDILVVNDAVYDKDKDNVLKNAYAFIQLSRHEGQPMGIIEALSVGLPCIVSYQTNFGEFVNKYESGIGVSLNEEEIFDSIKKIYENKELRDKYSKNAYKYTNDLYNFENISKKCIDEYKKILGE